MSTNGQQLLPWAVRSLARCGDGGEQAVDDKPVLREADPSRKCSACGAVIGVNAVGCDECWHYCMEDTSP